jgi:hypothetical protein
LRHFVVVALGMVDVLVLGAPQLTFLLSTRFAMVAPAQAPTPKAAATFKNHR